MFNFLANPERFLRFAKYAQPIFSALAILLIGIGTVWSLGFAPADYQQGHSARIMFIHLPAAWLSSFAYLIMVVASILFLVWRHSLADLGAKAAAELGAIFSFATLVTGAIWGKPTWGTWWVWDGRLTSMLVLFFIYLGYIALKNSISDETKSAKTAAIFCLVGSINLPIIKFSVDWWNTLHQPASIFRKNGPAISSELLNPLIIMILGFGFAFAALLILRTKTLLTQKRIKALKARLAYGGDV